MFALSAMLLLETVNYATMSLLLTIPLYLDVR